MDVDVPQAWRILRERSYKCGTRDSDINLQSLEAVKDCCAEPHADSKLDVGIIRELWPSPVQREAQWLLNRASLNLVGVIGMEIENMNVLPKCRRR